MHILYHQDPRGNFGDDLNAFLWKELLPQEVLDHPDVVLLGIGSIFNSGHASERETVGRRVYVLGSGAGYGALPSNFQDWSILCVRGPLTARLIGRPELAATDAAALLAATNLAKLNEKRDLVLFMPHHDSLHFGAWQQVAEDAGLTFVSPRLPAEETLQLFSRARLVIAEAMHGAIVADTMRIPWVPVTTAPGVFPFKWRDWTGSLDLPYKPIHIPPSTFEDFVRHRRYRQRALALGLGTASPMTDLSEDSLVADYYRRYPSNSKPPDSVKHQETLVKRFATYGTKALGIPVTPFFKSRAIKSLRGAIQAESFLSRDSCFQSKLVQLLDAKDRLVRELSS